MTAVSILVFVVTGPTPLVFGDDFETGDLSKWDAVVPAPPTTVDAGPVARRSGNQGMVFDDPDVSSGAGLAANVVKGYGGQTNLYARFWMKVMSTNPGIVLPVIIKDSVRNQALAQIGVFANGGLLVGGYSNNSFVSTQLNGRVDGGWQLLEIAALNVGSGANGAHSVWLDGQPIGSNAMNFNSKIADQTVLGGTWEDDRRWAGAIWFDDLRLRSVPHTSTLRTNGGASNAGECFAVVVDLLDSRGAGSEEAFVLPITWALAGPAVGPFSDSSCTAPPALAVPDGTFDLTQYVLLTGAGTVTVEAKSTDFITIPGTISVSSDGGFVYDAGTDTDAGVPPMPRQERVECGCSSAGAPLAVLLLLSGARARRRDRLRS